MMDKRFYLQDSLYKGIIDKGVDFAICGVGAFLFFRQETERARKRDARPHERGGHACACRWNDEKG